MASSLLDDAFAHHTWATLRLLDACAGLTQEQLETDMPGMPGSILLTLQHLVGSDDFDLCVLSPDRAAADDTKKMNLSGLRLVVERAAEGWARYLQTSPDPDTVVLEVDPGDGFERDAPVGIRLAQALHHGSDHRSQVCSALTTLGIEPPSIDVFDFAVESRRSSERMP